MANFGIKVKSVTIPPVIGEGERKQNYDQSFSQVLLYGEVRKKITCLSEDLFKGSINPPILVSRGLVQTLEAGSNKVLARFDDGNAAIVLARIGKGTLYYLASPLQTSDYHLLLSPLVILTGLNRPLLAQGNDGNPVTGAEVRAVERDNDYLVYASNLTSDTIEFDLTGEFNRRAVMDLRRMFSLDTNHIMLAPYEETILKVEKTLNKR
jgi:hypothetical protein